MKLGIMIKLYRQKNDLSARFMSKVLGISNATLSRLENGKKIDSDRLMKILLWVTH